MRHYFIKSIAFVITLIPFVFWNIPSILKIVWELFKLFYLIPMAYIERFFKTGKL